MFFLINKNNTKHSIVVLEYTVEGSVEIKKLINKQTIISHGCCWVQNKR